MFLINRKQRARERNKEAPKHKAKQSSPVWFLEQGSVPSRMMLYMTRGFTNIPACLKSTSSYLTAVPARWISIPIYSYNYGTGTVPQPESETASLPTWLRDATAVHTKKENLTLRGWKVRWGYPREKRVRIPAIPRVYYYKNAVLGSGTQANPVYSLRHPPKRTKPTKKKYHRRHVISGARSLIFCFFLYWMFFFFFFFSGLILCSTASFFFTFSFFFPFFFLVFPFFLRIHTNIYIYIWSPPKKCSSSMWQLPPGH